MKFSKNNDRRFAILTVFRKCVAYISRCFVLGFISAYSLSLRRRHSGVMLCVQLGSRVQREIGDTIKPHSLPPVTDFLQQSSTSPSFHSVKSSTPTGAQVSNMSILGTPHIQAADRSRNIYDTHLGLSPIPHIILQSLLPLFFLFLLIFCMVSELPKRSQSRDQSKEVNRCSKAHSVSWSTNPGSGKDSPHALSLSR